MRTVRLVGEASDHPRPDGITLPEKDWPILLASLAGQDADTIAGSVEQAVLDFGEPEPRDDMAVLVLRLRPGVASAAEAV